MSNVEEQARAMGWVDKGEFKGDPDKWRPAEEFLERGKNILPILTERYDALEQKFNSVSDKLEKTTQNLTRFAEFHKGTYKRAYDNAKRKIEAKLAEAEQTGDLDAYKRGRDELENLEREQAKIVDDGQVADKNSPPPEYHDFAKANNWYGKDVAMTVFTDAMATQLQGNPNIHNNVEFYAELERLAREHFPHKFQDPNSQSVELGGGEGSGDGNKGNKKWGDLPRVAQDTYLREFSDIPGFTKEQYAKDYFEQEGV
jgi:hypothetical protein